MTYRVNGKIVTKEEWDALPQKGITFGKPSMIHSRQPFVSPIDGSIISSGSDLINHEKEHNVIQVGDAYEKIVNHKREEQRERQFESSRDAERDRRNFNWN